MKVKIADSTGCPVPQIVLHAETDEDMHFIKLFATFPEVAKEKWTFKLHGATSSIDRGGYVSMNIGFAKVSKEYCECCDAGIESLPCRCGGK